MVKFATLEKTFLAIFSLMIIIALTIVVPTLLSKWSLQQQILDVGKCIEKINSDIEELEKLKQQTDDPQKKQALEQEINNLKQQKDNLKQESNDLNDKLSVINDVLQGRQFIGLILLILNLAVVGVVAVFGSLRIRDEEEEKLFK